MQKVYEEKIAGLQALQQERQQLFDQQLKAAENKTGVNWVIVIIAVVIGLIIGYLIKSH